MNKKRVLLMGEAHYLSSGFGTYANELLTRLHKTGKYEVAEFASYGSSDLKKFIPWLYYGNMPEENNKKELDLYHSNPAHQFGTWRFERACLDFKPDIVLSYRDPWMDNWIQDCAVRKYFHWIWMPTVDSAPQRQEWVNTFSKCDAVLTYSEVGSEVLKNQGKEKINVVGCASPGIDPSVYKPMPKKEHRKSMGIDPDCFIVGTVMRNQKRKLFFELMKSFRLFLDQAPSDVANKTFLYLHTSYPEKVGWDIAQGIMEYDLGGKVLMTYICKSCRKFFPNMFQDALCKCIFCNQQSAVCPTVSFGVSVADLAKIYNLFDIYIQYAICEGFGMPQVEAGACGVPIAATNYSAMRDVLHFTKGYAIPIKTFFRELETNAERAYPDNEILAKTLLNFFTKSETDRLQQSLQVRQDTIKRYNWDDTAKIWENYIDSYTPKDLQGNWGAPPTITNVPNAIPPNLSNEAFIAWIFNNVLNEPEKQYENEGVELYRSLSFGADMSAGNLSPINRDNIFKKYLSISQNRNNLEGLRVGATPIPPQQFIINAHDRKKIKE